LFKLKYIFFTFQRFEQVAGGHRREDRDVHLLHDHLSGQHHQRLHPRLGTHPRHPGSNAGKLDRLCK